LEDHGVMPEQSQPSRQVQRRYPPEIRERAVRLVFETAAEQGEWHGAVGKVSKQLGIGPESLRHWVRQAEIDRGQRPGLTSAEQERIKVLERENRELRRANEILKSAAVFFGAELDRRSPR
jgi:transposase